ncbi:PREDICTED: auxin-responsive protein SAUR19-like [Ipomoea nil]|uniref:auxin-responsive protein SAUR19-like n=1 Tax=Ipomoea nil TaxID=35883 RepID=UPI00090174FF|nr:PREDICTED: auxin-responsive protein SAUR19-like [Ipomoea nil]
MLGKKIDSVKKLGRKARVMRSSSGHEESQFQEYLLKGGREKGGAPAGGKTAAAGTFAVYVGEERQRFVVPTSYLSHPLFKILLEKACDEFGFAQRGGLAVPCSVAAFREVVSAVECCNGQFCFGELV